MRFELSAAANDLAVGELAGLKNTALVRCESMLIAL